MDDDDWGGWGAAGELEDHQQQQQRNESSKSAELEGITRRQYLLLLFLFVFVVAWDYFGGGFGEFAYTSYS